MIRMCQKKLLNYFFCQLKNTISWEFTKFLDSLYLQARRVVLNEVLELSSQSSDVSTGESCGRLLGSNTAH